MVNNVVSWALIFFALIFNPFQQLWINSQVELNFIAGTGFWLRQCLQDDFSLMVADGCVWIIVSTGYYCQYVLATIIMFFICSMADE